MRSIPFKEGLCRGPVQVPVWRSLNRGLSTSPSHRSCPQLLRRDLNKQVPVSRPVAARSIADRPFRAAFKTRQATRKVSKSLFQISCRPKFGHNSIFHGTRVVRCCDISINRRTKQPFERRMNNYYTGDLTFELLFRNRYYSHYFATACLPQRMLRVASDLLSNSLLSQHVAVCCFSQPACVALTNFSHPSKMDLEKFLGLGPNTKHAQVRTCTKNLAEIFRAPHYLTQPCHDFV